MKYSILTICLLFCLLVTSSCEEDASIATVKDDVESNELQDLSPSTITLLVEEADNDFQEIQWTAPDFGYQALVTYTVQLDVQGFDFANAINIATTNSPSAIVSNAIVNEALLGLGIPAGEETPIQFRVISNIGAGRERVFSNAISATITPYAPASNPTLFIIGDAQGWDLGAALQLEFVGAGVFEGIGEFVNPGNFRFFETPSWDADQLGAGDFSTIDSELSAVGDGDDNFSFDGTPGIYKITVAVNSGTITMEPAAMPDLFIIGDDQGWDLGNAFSLTWMGGAKFEGTTTFSNNSIFRFFETPDWGAQQYNYTFFTEVDDAFDNGGGGDSNLLMLSATGTYTISVDLINKTVVLE